MKLKLHSIWPFLLIFAIYVVSSQPSLATPRIGISYDKLAHFLVFGLLATAIIRIPAISRKGWQGVLTTVLCVSLWGALDEFRQMFTEGRSVEIADWVADTFGAIVASVLYLKLDWYRRILEMGFFKNKELSE